MSCRHNPICLILSYCLKDQIPSEIMPKCKVFLVPLVLIIFNKFRLQWNIDNVTWSGIRSPAAPTKPRVSPWARNYYLFHPPFWQVNFVRRRKMQKIPHSFHVINISAHNFLVDIHSVIIQMQMDLNPFLRSSIDFNSFPLVL